MVSYARTIEVNVISATDLKKKKFGGEQRCYAVAYIYAAQRQATHADPAGGINPTWNAPLALSCYETDLYPDGTNIATASSSSNSKAITVDIYSHCSGIFSSGDKLVGTVVIPLLHFASAVWLGTLQSTFDVRRPSGRVQGKLYITVKLGEMRPLVESSASPASQMPSYEFYDRVETSHSRRPLVASYNTTSGAQSTQGVYEPNFNTFGKEEIVTGYPVSDYEFSPLGPLGAAHPPQVGHGSYVTGSPVTRAPVTGALESRRRQKQTNHRTRVFVGSSAVEQQQRRRKRLTKGMMIAGAVILALVLL